MATPTLSELTTQVRQDLSAEGVSQVWVRRSFENALSTVLAGLLWVYYKWLDSIVKQCNPATATGIWLDLWARLFGLTRVIAGTATGGILINGITGSIQPAGSTIIGPDGQSYTTDDACTMEGDEGVLGSGLVNVTATASGDAFNLPVGTALTVASPATGIASALVAFLGLNGGQTGEDDEALRARLLTRIQRPAESGTAADYRRWTREASPAVSRVWVYECGRLGNEGGKVLVMMAVSGSNPIPQPSVVSAVTAALATKREAGMLAQEVRAPDAQTVDLTIALESSTTANQDRVTGFLRDLFTATAPGVLVRNLDIQAAIARAGILFHLQAVAGGSGTSDVTPTSLYHLPILGTITWTVYQ